MLMNHANTSLDSIGWGGNINFLAVNYYFPFIRLIQPVKDIHERGLASAIFPQ